MASDGFPKFLETILTILRTVLISPPSIPPQAGRSTHETSYFSFPPVYGEIKGVTRKLAELLILRIGLLKNV
jgi:hypothetical protein